MTTKRTLISIAPSHYCEKARWALERAGLDYTEENYAPVLHMARTVPLGKRKTPILITPHGAVDDSTAILHLVDSWGEPAARLFPTDDALRKDVEEWEELFDAKLGPATRRVAYFYVLDDPGLFRAINESRLGPAQRALFRSSAALLRRMIRKGLRINLEGKQRSQIVLEQVLSKVEDALADGRRFLVGDRFTAADLTFAALLSPLLASTALGKNRGTHLDGLTLPAELSTMIEAIRTRPAGRFALRLIDEERFRKN